ncbi:MAG: 2OG-Fe(II) oxygenase family protein [Allosphingosinicella sp.]
MIDEARRRLAAADPADPDAAFAAAAAALRAGLEDEAVPLLQRALKAQPQVARLWQMLGLAWRGLDELAASVPTLEYAARLGANDALIAHAHARAAMEAGLPAVALFDRARRLAPADLSILQGRAAALLAEGRLDQAIADLDAELAARPDWLAGHAGAARLRWMRGERDGFTQSFERALALRPGDHALWAERIDTLMHAELYEQALAAIAAARAATGAIGAFDALEAVAYAERGETATADRLFARLGPPRHISLVVRLVRHLLRSGRPDQAAALAEAHVGGEGGDALWPYLSAAWRLTGDTARWEWLEGDPSFVGIYDLAERLGPLDALAARLRALHLSTHQPLEQSVRGGTQTDGPLFARLEPEIRALRQAVAETVAEHIAQLPPPRADHPLLRVPRRGRIRFSGSWSVRLTGGGRHTNHIHPAGWFSSALYVALPPEEQRGPAPAGWLTLGEATELGLDLPPFRTVEPKPGRLVLFPSTMWHGTRPFEAGERLTVAFDVAPLTG